MKKLIIITILLILLFFGFFLRYPKPIIRKNNFNHVYSPAFGKIMSIKNQDDNSIYIAIFLSPLDVHYQFYPVSGKITDMKYDATGKFNLAYELNKSNENEKSIYTIENKNGIFKVYQIAGWFVRRISTYGKIGQDIQSGECMGLIYMGSRVDIIIPNADKFNLLVKEREYMNGFNTLLGYY